MFSGNGNVEVSVPYDVANDLSIKLMNVLDQSAAGAKEIATAMTLGRLLAWPKILTPEDEQAYVEAIFDFTETFWPEGGAN